MKAKGAKNKRVVFVYRESLPGSSQEKATKYIINSLKKKYDIETYRGLDKSVIELMSSNLTSNKFNALITNIPYKSSSVRIPYSIPPASRERMEYEESYKDSLGILRQIKILQDIPIIAYTGAGGSPVLYGVFWEGAGVDIIVEKTADFKKDFKEIESSLETLIRHYDGLPFIAFEPAINLEGNYTTAEARINLNGGIGLSAASAICRESGDYKGDVAIKSGARTCDAKSVLGLISSALEEGNKVTILVKGLDEKAKSLVKRLYSIFTSRYCFKLNLDKSEYNRKND